MSVTDAKPLLPENVTNFFVEFSGVMVHKLGEGWVNLPLVASPYTIDLLQFHDGASTELVPPTKFSSGKYTQIRFEVSSATIRITNDDETTEDLVVEIPSEYLKTDKNFTVDVSKSSAIDLIVHFDLSMSLVISGTESEPEYELKPVLHIFDDPLKAATISGRINSSSIENTGANIAVILHSNDETFTQVVVSKSTDSTESEFSIFWLVPGESYKVEIDLDQDGTVDCTQFVEAAELLEGELFLLNGDNPISSGEGICALIE